MKSPAKILEGKTWDNVALRWDEQVGDKGFWHQVHDIDPVLFGVIGNAQDKSVLEIGCGNGYLSRILAKRGASVVGIDISR